MIKKEKLQEYAKKLMFDMKDEEYETLAKEFEIITKKMDIIGEIDNLDQIQPMTFPFPLENVSLREDVASNTINIEDIKVNAKELENDQVKIPKVVE